jgi:two-component system response regulator HupR/HoxA
VLGEELLSPRVRQNSTSLVSLASGEESEQLKHQLDRLEGQLIRAAMLRHRGNKTRVADELGLTRVGLRMKLNRLGLV